MEKSPKQQSSLTVPNFEQDSYPTHKSNGHEAVLQKPKIPTKLRNQFDREWAHHSGLVQPQKQKTDKTAYIDDSVSLYLRSIGRNPLLTKDGEAFLSSIIQQGRNADIESDEYWKSLWAKDKLVVSNLRLVVSIAKRYSKVDGTVPLLDLVQEGTIGLERAASKFDWRRGFKFSTYATWWVKQSISRSGLTLNTTMHVPSGQKDIIKSVYRVMMELESEGRPVTAKEVAHEAHMDIKRAEQIMLMGQTVINISLNRPIDSIDSYDDNSTFLGDLHGESDQNYNAVEVDMCLDAIRILMDELSERERSILERRYGFNGIKEQTYREIGEEFGVTHEAIRQIERRALRKMRQSETLEELVQLL